MAEITYNPTEEGDLFSAEELNQTFTGISVALNDVPTYGMPEGALRHEHFDVNIMPDTGTLIGSFENPARTAPTAVYPGHDQDATWAPLPNNLRVLNLNGGAGYNLADGGEIQGILVLANVLCASITHSASRNVSHQAAFVLQMEVDIGGWVWRTIPYTERFVSQGRRYDETGVNDCDIDVPIRCLINSSTEHITATQPIRSVRVVGSVLNLAGTGGTIDVVALRGNLTVIPLHMLKS